MTTKIIIIVGVSVATVLAMFVMGWFLDRNSKADSSSEDTARKDVEKEDAARAA